MGQVAASLGGSFIEQPVPIDDFVLRIAQQGDGEVAVCLRFHFRDHLRDVFEPVGSDTNNHTVSFALLRQQTLQLHELLRAVGSPVAAVEDENYILIAQR